MGLRGKMKRYFNFKIELIGIDSMINENKYNHYFRILEITYICNSKIKSRALLKIRYTSSRDIFIDIFFFSFGFIKNV